MRVIIAGGGIVGLTTGIAMKSIGAEVLICEQAPEIRAAGAAIGLWRNALDVFSEYGVGQQIEAIGSPIETWFYDASGHRFRDPDYGPVDHSFLLLPRPQLNSVLADAVGRDNIRLGAKVVGACGTCHGSAGGWGVGRRRPADRCGWRLLAGARASRARVSGP
jgi:2-polyprenyl-6-methoxyphenol hydroxylase-like FAD-dependent oxidoreductase